MTLAQRLMRRPPWLRLSVVPRSDRDDTDLAYDLNEAQETFFSRRNDQLLLVGGSTTNKLEILEWLASNLDDPDAILFLDYTLPPVHDLDAIRLVEEALVRTEGPLYLFVNEFHYVGDWHGFLKCLHDHYPRVRLAGASSLSGPVHVRLFEEPLDFCRIVVLSDRNTSNQKTVSEGFGVHNGLKYNVKCGEVEIKGLTKEAKSATRVDVPAEIDGKPVTIIASGAFHDRSTLGEVTLPASIRMIGDYAFSRCTSLKRMALPSAVEHIGDNAFLGCSKLVTIEGGEGLGHIGSCALHATGWMGRQREGLITLGRVLIACSGRKEEVLVPEEVEVIADHAFAGNERIRRLTVANPSCRLGEGFAYGCRNLHTFSFRGGRSEIPPFAFAGCVGLRQVETRVVGSIGDFAFHGCAGLPALYAEGNLWIGHCAFLGDDALACLHGEHSVSSVGNGAFYANRSLEFGEGFLSRASSVGHLAFLGANLRKVKIDCSTVIGGWAFAQCGKLASVQVPAPLCLGPGTFADCEALSEVAISGHQRLSSLFGGPAKIPLSLKHVTVCGDRIVANFLRDCTSIRSLRITSSIREWGRWAFQGCTDLEDVRIEDGVSEIGDWAFAHCDRLCRIGLPRSVGRVGMNAFRYCRALREVSMATEEEAVNVSVNAFYANHEERRFIVPAAMIDRYRQNARWREHLASMRTHGHED